MVIMLYFTTSRAANTPCIRGAREFPILLLIASVSFIIEMSEQLLIYVLCQIEIFILR